MNSLEQQVGLLKMTARNICEELLERGVEFEIIDVAGSLIRYKAMDGSWHYLRSSLSDKTSALALLVADQKPLTYSLCERLQIRVPQSYVFSSEFGKEDLVNKARELLGRGTVLVIKPSDAAHGHGVTTNIRDEAVAQIAAEFAAVYSESIILQEMAVGDDIRVIVIEGQYVIAIKRVPAQVVGDGILTIKQLIERENSTNKDRSFDFTTKLSAIPLEAAENFIGSDRFDTEVPEAGQMLRVIGPSNMSLGGTLENVTDLIPKQLIEDAIKITDELGMVCCAADFILGNNGQGTLLEINASPALFTLDDPYFGTSSGAIKKFVDAIL